MDEWIDYDSRWMVGTIDDNCFTKLDEHRSRVPGATDRGITLHSEETLVLVHAVTLAPLTITSDRYKIYTRSNGRRKEAVDVGTHFHIRNIGKLRNLLSYDACSTIIHVVE